MVTWILMLLACKSEAPPTCEFACQEEASPPCEADLDGDGWTCASDCDDNEAAVNPDAEETCDGIDNNCDGLVDTSPEVQGYYDEDGDIFVGIPSYSLCDDDLYYVSNDCDESDPLTNDGAPERCDDGIDNNCDGNIDELGCASWVKVGEDPQTGLGWVMDVATADRSHWATLSYGIGVIPPTVRSFQGDPGEIDFAEAWRYEGGIPSYLGMAVAAWEGRRYMAMVNASVGTAELLEVEEGEATPTLLASHGLGPFILKLSLESSTDGLVLAAGSYDGQVLMFDDPDQGDASFNDGRRFLVQAASYETYLGESVLLLPDPGGDGVPELVMFAERDDDKDAPGNIYLFDGLASGTVSLDDADAILLDVPVSASPSLESAGDLDGDGQVDLAAGRCYFRPLEGELNGRAPDITFGDAIAGASLDDDEYIDLATRYYDGEGRLCVLYGPLTAGSYSCGSADLSIPFHFAVEAPTLLTADVDADGQAELLMGWEGYYSDHVEGVGTIGPGLITAYDIHTWDY